MVLGYRSGMGQGRRADRQGVLGYRSGRGRGEGRIGRVTDGREGEKG